MKKLVLALSLLTLTACSKLTMANYDLLKLGMSKSEVTTIIGEPTNCSTTLGVENCIWGKEDGKNIKVNFVGDNAATFSNNGLK